MRGASRFALVTAMTSMRRATTTLPSPHSPRADASTGIPLSSPFDTYRLTCGARLVPDLERRPGNALNVEIGQARERCLDKSPAEWAGRGVSGVRWLGSGGSPLVFGVCSPACPRLCSHKDGEFCWWCSAAEGDCPHDRPYPAECPECKAAFIAGIEVAVKP